MESQSSISKRGFALHTRRDPKAQLQEAVGFSLVFPLSVTTSKSKERTLNFVSHELHWNEVTGFCDYSIGLGGNGKETLISLFD